MKKPSSPAFQITDILLKTLMCLVIVAFASFCFFEGYDMASWYPSFTDLRMGPIMMVLSGVLAFFSVLVFKKKNFGSLLLIAAVALLDYGAYVYNAGFGRQIDEFITLFFITLLFLYCVSKLIERKI